MEVFHDDLTLSDFCTFLLVLDQRMIAFAFIHVGASMLGSTAAELIWIQRKLVYLFDALSSLG